MKSTDEPFDNQLRERLLNYTEESDKDLWKGIAPNIVSANPEPGWVVWSSHLSVVIVLSVIFMFYPSYDGANEHGSVDRAASDSSAIGIAETPVHHQRADVPVAKEIRPNKDQIDASGLPFSPSGQHRLKRLSFDLPEEENSLTILSNVLALAISGTVMTISGHSSSDTTPRIQNADDKALPAGNSIGKKKSRQLNKKLRKYKPFSLYLTAMPTFGYQRIVSNNNDNIFIEGIKRVPAFSVDRLGVRIEAGAEVPISKRWTASGAILYYQRKQTISYTERRVDTLVFDSNSSGGIMVEPELNYLSASTEYELKNVGLQAGISYRLWIKTKKRITTREALSSENLLIPKRKFLHVVGSGIEFHKPLNRTRSFQRAEGFSDPTTYVFFNLYYRLQYPITEKLRAVLQPTLNYSFYINADLNAPFYVKPYGLGLNFGCSYRIR